MTQRGERDGSWDEKRRKKQSEYNRRFWRKKLEEELARNYCRYHGGVNKCGSYKNARVCYLMRQKQNRGVKLKEEISPPKFWLVSFKRKEKKA